MSFWTDENVIKLMTMWKNGNSASVIAKELSTTRNAVIGKVFRLQLARRTTVRAFAERKPPRLPRDPKPRTPYKIVISPISGSPCVVARKKCEYGVQTELTKFELRRMLTQAVINTGGVA